MEGCICIGTTGMEPFHTYFENDGGIFQARSDFPLLADHQLAGDFFTGLQNSDGDELYEQWIGPENLARLGWGWAATPVDIDADGWMGLVFNGNNCPAPMDIIWNEEKGASPGGILRNANGAGFVDKTWEWELANLDKMGRYPDGRGLAVGDLNNDG